MCILLLGVEVFVVVSFVVSSALYGVVVSVAVSVALCSLFACCSLYSLYSWRSCHYCSVGLCYTLSQVVLFAYYTLLLDELPYVVVVVLV